MDKLKQMNNIIEFNAIMKDIIVNHKVQEMKKYRQHGNINYYEVAFVCYKICKKMKLNYKSITKATMLHDMFLYDWHDPKSHKRLHGFRHAKTTCENECKEFDLSSKEQDIIKKHMWPLTIIPPKSVEEFILTVVNKYCTIMEMIKK